MKTYFISPKERKDSCYYEFYKGKWDNKTFWKEDSICIHDNHLLDSDFDRIIIEIIPEFNPFGKTEITKKQWKKIKNKSISVGGKAEIIVKEADEWINDTFAVYDIFTILGL